MTHGIIYDRASTKNQKDNYSRVNAREVGIKVAEQYCSTWEYIKEIGSGTTLTGRPELMKILDRIAAGEIQVIIVQDLDRLARPEEAVVYSTIRQVIMEYNVIIYTHTSRVDLNNDDDDFVADITMSVAKKERRRILKRMKRSKKAKADQGCYVSGAPGLGYEVVYPAGTKNGDLAILEKEVKLVKLIMDTLESTGGSYWATAKKLNEQGYTGKSGKLFTANSIKVIASRKLYIGIFETKITDKITHRPDLQIISVSQFEHVQELIKRRARQDKPSMGKYGHYILTGFVACGHCGGPTHAANMKKFVAYQCSNYRHFGRAACSGKTYTEHLILPPIIEFLAGFIQSQIDFLAAADTAAAQYGKSVTEEALEAAVQGELASVQAGKQRLIEAISLGILTNQEAAVKLAELREQEQRLTIELSSIAEKTAIMAQWQIALDALKGQDITGKLYELAEREPIALRRILSIVFEPNSIRVRTQRRLGSKKWVGILEDYKLTEGMQAIPFANEFLNSFTNDIPIFELAGLLA